MPKLAHSVPLTSCRRGAPFLPPNLLPLANPGSDSRPHPTQTTTKPILSGLSFGPVPVPDASLITPTPLNLHKRLPTNGSLQTAVSHAPPGTFPNLPAHLPWGASDTALAFLDRRRSAPDYSCIADNP